MRTKFREGRQVHHWCWSQPSYFQREALSEKLLCSSALNIYFNLFLIVISRSIKILFIFSGRSPLKCSVFYHVDKSVLGRIISTFKVLYVFQVHDSSALRKSIIFWHIFKCCNLIHL